MHSHVNGLENNLINKEMYKSKYPSLIDFLTNQEDLILLDSEIQNIENLIDKDLKAITVTRCCKRDSELLSYVKEDKLGQCLTCGDTDCCDDFCNG